VPGTLHKRRSLRIKSDIPPGRQGWVAIAIFAALAVLLLKVVISLVPSDISAAPGSSWRNPGNFARPWPKIIALISPEAWKNGAHSHSTVEGFYGLGQEQHHKKTFTFDADHPEIFASEDKGATPVDYVLVGLASCLTAGIAAVAQHRNIQLRSVTATIEGDMDIQGILGIDDEVRNGFSGIKVTYKIDADAKREDIEALVAQSQKRSAVYDIVTNPTNVTVVVD